MIKRKIIAVANLGLTLSFLVTAVTGIIMGVVFSSGEGTGQRIWLGLARHSWSDLHTWAGIIMVVLTIFHIWIYRKVFIVMTKNLFKDKNV